MSPTVWVHCDRMDVNYSRWMSKDPDAEPEVIEDEPRRFSFPRPTRSVVATGAMLALVTLGGGALARSLTTSEAPSNDDPTVGTITSDQSSGPGAASIEDIEGSIADDAESDQSASDESPAIAGGATIDHPGPAGTTLDRRLMLRREYRRAHGIPPGPPRHVVAVPWPGPRHLDDADNDDDDDD